MVATVREQITQRWGALKTERSEWFDHWREISDYLLPRQGRFFATDNNSQRGGKKHNNILDSTATRSNRVLAAGLMAGMTSPARPWFRLATPDEDLNEVASVKVWLDDVTKAMRNVFTHSNTYRSLHMLYRELGGFGTGVSLVLDDFDNVLHHYPFTIGEYAIATDSRDRVNTVYREMQMRVGALVAEFGRENCSSTVRTLYDRGNVDSWVRVMHVIEPRSDRDPTKKDGANMPFRSTYVEWGADSDKLLRDRGFRRFPGIAGRWDRTPGDIYGSSPGMEALGDIKQLQHQQLRKAQAIDFQTLPPLQAVGVQKDREAEMLPGGITYVEATGQGAGLRPAFEANLNLQWLGLDILDVRQRIQRCFHEDMFLMLANDQRSGVTAREIAERHEEKLLMLGPVLEGLHDELLSPLIDLAFDKLLAAGALPPPPPELEGMDLTVNFVSMLAQAQRAVGLGAVDRLVGTLGSIAAIGKPEVLDKLDGDQLVDAYSDMLGVDPSLIVADDKVALIREQRAQQQAAVNAAAMAPQQAQTAKTLSETDTEGKNALTDALNMFSGYGAP